MELIRGILDWFAGGSRQYMTLYHCMSHDVLWVAITVALDLAVAAGYSLIALHWWRNQRQLENEAARTALGRMRNIFVLCGLCGYLFIPIKMVWPAWRLYDLILVGLAYYTWRYAWNAKDLKVIYHEIDRSHHLQRELTASREEAQKRRLFLNAVGHDLKSPLNAVTLQSELAQQQLAAGDVDGARQTLSMIRSGAHQAGGMLNDFLEISQLDHVNGSPQTSAFNGGEMLHELVAVFDPVAVDKGLTLQLDCPVDLQLHTDRRKLQSIVTHLLNNAIRFTDRGGKVLARTWADGDDAVIEVSDTGRGVAAEHLDRLFDEFYQVDNNERDHRKGFGLGLAFARGLVDQLGGRIDVRSRVGRGSRFTVRLPGAIQRDDAAAQRHADARVIAQQ